MGSKGAPPIACLGWDRRGDCRCRCWQGAHWAHPLARAKISSTAARCIFILCLCDFLRLDETFRVSVSLEFVSLDRLRWFVLCSCPLGPQGLFRACVPDPEARPFIQLVNKQSLQLQHKWQCMDWPLRKPVLGAAAGPSGKEAHPQYDVPGPFLQGSDPCVP